MKPARRLLAVVSLAFLLFPLAPRPASATGIPVIDAAHIASSTLHQVLHYIARALEIVQKYQILYRQYEQIQNQLQALKKLENPNWREVASLLWTLDSILRREGALSYTLDDIEARLRAAFPGWQEWTDWKTQDRDRIVQVLTTMRNALLTQHQAGRLVADQFTLGDIKKTAATIKGHQEALELLATVGTYNAEELLLIRQALYANANAQSVYTQLQLQREASDRASYIGLAERTSAPPTTPPASFRFEPAWWPY